MGDSSAIRVSLFQLIKTSLRIGFLGFGGPPAHIALLRKSFVQDKNWINTTDFEEGIAAANLLPGPASTQLAIYCGWLTRGPLGAFLAGISFILPGFLIIVPLAMVFLANDLPLWLKATALGATSTIPAIALYSGYSLMPDSWKRIRDNRIWRLRWLSYIMIGIVSVIVTPVFLAPVILICGLFEMFMAKQITMSTNSNSFVLPLAFFVAPCTVFISLAWIAVKVGALSYGGGFVIVPMMQHDAVNIHHWLNNAQFLNAVTLGQITPGPVVLTVAVIGFAASGIWGALFITALAFLPSFMFVIGGAKHLTKFRQSRRSQAFFRGAGPVTIGAICGSAIPLASSLTQSWQWILLILNLPLLILVKRNPAILILFFAAVGLVLEALGVVQV